MTSFTSDVTLPQPDKAFLGLFRALFLMTKHITEEFLTGQLGMTLNYRMAIKNASATWSVMGRRPLNKPKNALSGCGSVTSHTTDVILPTYTLTITDSHSNNSMMTTHSNHICLA